jgi:hypothetical protein
MRSLLAIFILFATLQVKAEMFSLPQGGVTLNAPDGFTQLSPEEIAAKYPSARRPSFVVGNARRTTTIAMDLKPHTLPPEKLPEVKASFEKLFDRIVPGIEWKERKLIDMQGQQWIYFEMTSRAVDTDIYNIMLVTPHRGKMLVFNFNSTKGEFPQVESELRKSIQTIALPRT